MMMWHSAPSPEQGEHTASGKSSGERSLLISRAASCDVLKNFQSPCHQLRNPDHVSVDR